MYNVDALTAPQRKLLAAIAQADATRFDDDGADYRLDSGADRRVAKRLEAAGWITTCEETECEWTRRGMVDVNFRTAVLSFIGDSIVGEFARKIVYTQGVATVTVWIDDNGCSEDLVYRFECPGVYNWGTVNEGDDALSYLWSNDAEGLAAQVYAWLA